MLTEDMLNEEGVLDSSELRKRIILITAGVITLIGIVLAVVFGVFWPVEQKNEIMHVELGTPVSTDPADYLKGYGWSVNFGKLDLSQVDATKVGTYTAICTHGKEEYVYQIVIEDTTSPEITAKDGVFYIAAGREYQAVDLVSSVVDVSGQVTTVVKNETGEESVVIFEEVGDYSLVVEATDASGNSSTLEVFFSVDTAPVISGMRNCYVTANNSQDLFAGVTANDDVDGDLTTSIVFDDSQIDWATEANYTASATVVDQYGLETTVVVDVWVLPKEDLENMVATREVSHLDSIVVGAANAYSAGAAQMESLEAQQEYMRNCVVVISDLDEQGYGWRGSGFVIDVADDYIYIASNKHVLNHTASTSDVFFYDGTRTSYELVGYNENGVDAAICKVPISSLSESTLSKLLSVHISSSLWVDNKQWGEEVFMIRAAENGIEAIRTGTTVRMDDFDYYPTEMVVTTMRNIGGDSGSALIDEYGNLVGMIQGGYRRDGKWEYHAVNLSDVIETYESLTGNTLYKN